MNGPLAAAARHPVMANMAMYSILVLGAVCYLNLTREIMPQFSADRVSISVFYEGASAREVEEGIVFKIEEALQGVDRVKSIECAAREGYATVIVELNEDVKDLDPILNDIRERVGTIEDFPEDAEEPAVKEVLLVQPSMLVVVHGRADERTLREAAQDMKDELLALPGLSQVELGGIRDYEISIEVSEAALRQYGLTLGGVAQAVRRASLNLPGGTIRTRAEQFKIEVQGRRYRGREYAEIPVLARPDGTVVRLRQVAEIRDAFEEDESLGRYNEEPAAIVRVLRTDEQDAIHISELVLAYLARKSQELPPGVKADVLGDFSVLITDRIDLLTRNGMQGLLLVFLSLFIFLNLRLSFWVTLGIPFAFATAGIVIWLSGCSLNMINLFGLILVLGMVVDDAIVVGENIYAHERAGRPRAEAAVAGATEVAWPVVGTVTTTAVAFLPLFFVSGIMGKFIAEIPVAVVGTLGGSLLESLFILPNHLGHRSAFLSRIVGARRRMLRERRGEGATAEGAAAAAGGTGELPGAPNRLRAWMDGRIEGFIDVVYTPLFKLSLRYRMATLALGLFGLLACGGLVSGGFVPFTLFPDADNEYLSARVIFPEGTPIETTGEAISRMEAALLGLNARHAAEVRGGPLVTGVYAESGVEGKIHEGTLYAHISGPETRSIDSERILTEWREAVGGIAGATSETYGPLGGPGMQGTDIEIYLLGKDLERLRLAGEELKDAIRQYAGTYDVTSDYQPGKRELQVALKPQGRALGITLQDLGAQLRTGFFGEEALRLQRGRDEVKVQVRYPKAERSRLDDLRRVRIRTPAGVEVPFDEVAEVKLANGVSEIRRRNGRRRVSVNAEVDEAQANADEILRDLEAHCFPELLARYPDLSISQEGPKTETKRSVQSLQVGFLISLVGIFAILALIFHSYLQPILIMPTIPLGIVGAIVGHWALGYQLNMMSLFGVVALAGVVVNDALVMIDRINERQRRGAGVLGSLHAAAPSRFRAIILTSLTTVAGLAPLLAERSFQAQFLIPMAVSLSGGLIFATALTLFFIPSLYLLLNDGRRVFHWLASGQWPTREDVEPGCHEFRERRAESGGGV